MTPGEQALLDTDRPAPDRIAGDTLARGSYPGGVLGGCCAGAALAPLAAEHDFEAPADLGAYVEHTDTGDARLHLMVDGIHCGGCIRTIEGGLARLPGVGEARLNMTTQRLRVTWDETAQDAAGIVGELARLGYRAVPFDPARLARTSDGTGRELLRSLAVAGFAAGNVMLLSVSVWAGHFEGMGPATRDLMHWISAAVALPAIAYAGQPFFRSALGALKARRLNMDVPISLAVVLAAGMSLVQTWRGAEDAWFDSAVTLLFFLLVGRYLDHRARGRARSAGEKLLALQANAVQVRGEDGQTRLLPPDQVRAGMRALVAPGERVPVDGVIREGSSDLDTSLITGEAMPRPGTPGTEIYAGTLNLSAALELEVTATGENTLLAGIARLMETAEQRKARYVALADRVARAYAPAVHGLAAITLAGWLVAGAGWEVSLLNAIAVLIITCPCALALAVPVVQVVASGRLLRQGILLKSGTALERLREIDTIVFDKTGTLTEGRPELLRDDGWSASDLAAAGRLAAASRHPLARALAAAAAAAPATGVREVPGSGLELDAPEGTIRLGSAAWLGTGDGDAAGPELWLARPGAAPVRFRFADAPRADAAEVVAELQRRGYAVALLSGDNAAAVAQVAQATGIADWRGGCRPDDKLRRLEELAGQGRRVCMVGDGLNDAPALAAAHVSLSPASAADISQTAADIVFQGARLAPVLEAFRMAHGVHRLVLQNFGLAVAYNTVTIPLAMAGFVTPLVAALAMSASSLMVIGNALRLDLGRRMRR
jgi:Cu2+-exporting ATPase